jgi:ferredoxin
MSFKVRITSADRTIDVPARTTILDAALDAGLSFPFGCQSGNCGACKSLLVTGEVTMKGYSEFALSDEEKARGLILACRAVPRAACEVAWLEEGRPDRSPAAASRLQGRGPRRRHARHQAHPPWRSSRAAPSTSQPASSPR